MKRICVIGSLNIDLSARLDKLPCPGETVSADSLDMFFGGKGANQAIAAGKMGMDTAMAGMLGGLMNGGDYLDRLKNYGVDCAAVGLVPGQSPGVAYIAVDGNGANFICFYPGANALMSATHIDCHWERISARDIFLFQQEIPAEANLRAMRRLKGIGGKLIIHDPAPADAFEPEYLNLCDIITPNETELEALSGVKPEGEETFREACERLRSMGAKTVIAKAGNEGAYLCGSGIFEHIPAFKMNAVDTTAAGDTFNAGLACGLSMGLPLCGSIALAHAMAGISTLKPGAQEAMPSADELVSFLKAENAELAGLLAEIQPLKRI